MSKNEISSEKSFPGPLYRLWRSLAYLPWVVLADEVYDSSHESVGNVGYISKNDALLIAASPELLNELIRCHADFVDRGNISQSERVAEIIRTALPKDVCDEVLGI